jgi:hypothetical protein
LLKAHVESPLGGSILLAGIKILFYRFLSYPTLGRVGVEYA